MADIKIAGRIKAGAADGISGYASEILFDDQASNKTVKEKIEEVVSSPQTMIVTITPDGNDGYEADKTFAEIAAFIDNGGTVIAKDEEDGDSYYYLDNYIASEVVFTRNIWGSGVFATRYYTIDNTNTVTFDDSLHHISSDVNSSSTANLANSAAVKAVNDALAAKQDTLTFDDTPTANSNNPVKSGGIKTALDAKQTTISTVNVTVDNNTGTPSGSASVSGSTLSLSFQNLKGATGATGATGPQGPQGERGLPGESGVTGDVSGFTVIQTIDPSATYGATDIAGAATVQATNAELTELAGEQLNFEKQLVVSSSSQNVRLDFGTANRASFKVDFDSGAVSAFAMKLVLYKDVVAAAGLVYEAVTRFGFNQIESYSGDDFNIAVIIVYGDMVNEDGTAIIEVNTGLRYDNVINGKAIDECKAQIEQIEPVMLMDMFYAKNYILNGSATYDDNGMLKTSIVKWANNIAGTLTKSNWNEDALEYATETVTYVPLSGTARTIVYGKIFNNDGELTKETITIN